LRVRHATLPLLWSHPDRSALSDAVAGPFMISRRTVPRQVEDAMGAVRCRASSGTWCPNDQLDKLEALLVDALPWARFLPVNDREGVHSRVRLDHRDL